jgi:hypothetical protein
MVTYENHGHEHRTDPVTDAVSAAASHPSAAVLASCSGAKRYVAAHSDWPEDTLNDPTHSTHLPSPQARLDNSLKIWSLQKT